MTRQPASPTDDDTTGEHSGTIGAICHQTDGYGADHVADGEQRPEQAELRLTQVKRRLVVSLESKRRRTDDGIDILPYSDFVTELAAGALW